MQINSVVNSQIIKRQQNFKGSPANSSVVPNSPNYQTIPLETSKAYVSPQISKGYTEIETFDIPYIGKGKLYELSNGHKIILIPKASKTYISTIVGVGFSDEPTDKKDIAHLTEHLLSNYWHNAEETSDVAKTLKAASTFNNASTSDTSTSFYMSANVQNNTDLDNLMKIQLGILTNNKYNNDKIEKEKNIIIEEAKENGYFIKPNIIAYDESVKNLFNLDDTNGLVAERNIKKIKNIQKEDLEKYYNDFYRPDNMTTIIIGNVDDNSIKTISKYLNKMSNTNSKVQRDNISNINEDKYIKQFKRTDIADFDKHNKYRGFANLSFIGPKIINTEDAENIMIINKIIKNRLEQQNIKVDVELQSVSQDVNIPQIISINGSDFEEKTENNIKVFYSVINDLVKNPVTNDELDKAKEQVFEDLLDNIEDNKSLANFLDAKLLSNSQMDINSSFKPLKNISSNDIQNVAKKYLDLNKASLVVIHPAKRESSITDKSNTTNVGQVTFKGSLGLKDKQDIKECDLPNNLHIIFDTRPGIIKTAVSCHFIFEDMQRNNKGIIDVMESSLETDGISDGNWINYEGVNIRKNGSSENIQKIINDVKNRLINPEFVNKKLEDAKKRQKENLLAENKKDAFDLLLENNHSPQKQNEICPEWIQTNDLKKYYNFLLTQSQGTIVITVPKEKLDEVENEIIKSLSEIPTVKPHDYSKILSQCQPKDLDKNSIFLDKQDYSDKVEIEKEFKIVSNGNIKDEAGIILLNEILSNKLQKTLRTDLGLTYVASSRVAKSSPKHGILTISTEIAKTPLSDGTKTALSQIDNIINELITSKVDDETLNSTKKQIKSNLLIPAEASLDRNMDLESDYRKTYDIHYYEKLAEALDNITSDDLQKLAQKYLTKPYLLEISGNKNAIEDNKTYFANLGEVIS